MPLFCEQHADELGEQSVSFFMASTAQFDHQALSEERRGGLKCQEQLRQAGAEGVDDMQEKRPIK